MVAILNTKVDRCRKYKKSYPDISPVINSISQDISTAGTYGIINISGYNFFPNSTSVNFGNYNDLPISYYSSVMISFQIPATAIGGNYSIVVTNQITTTVLPSLLYSNSVAYTIV